jgi:NAD(P)-dependent dehydrogenase (short-subunit alcohol dehydrogenase family)
LALAGIARKGAVVAIIADAEDDVAEALAACLRARGIDAKTATEVPSSATAVVFVGGLAAALNDDASIDVCRHAFRAARSFAAYAGDHGGAFVTVQDTGGDFGLRGSDRALLGGLAGLAKTADLEWPLASVKAIDVERGNRAASDVAQAIAMELLLGGPEIEVALRADGRRSTLRSHPAEATTAGLPAMSVLVCSGGARGVTAATLIALAKRYDAPPRIALLGRTVLEDEPSECVGIDGEANLKRTLMLAAKARGASVKPAEIGAQVRGIIARREIRATTAALKEAGSQASYYSTDVSDVESVRNVLDDVRAQWGPITAIVHGAGVVADKTIADKTDEQVERVFAPKVAGLRALLQATASDPINVLILFSSVAARTGNVGQCDYAMANEMLNKMAAREQRQRPGCLVKSLNWGPWEGGMVTPALKTYFESHGVPLIPLDTGAEMMIDELASTDPNIEIVLGGEPKRASIAGASGGQSLLVHVDATTDPHLVDHAIDGTVVLPMVAVLEWFTRAAEALHPGKVVTSCQRVRVLRGVPLTAFHDGGDTLLLRCGTLDGDRIELKLCDATDPRKQHYSAEITLADALPSAPTEPPPDRPKAPLSKPIYGDALFHGSQFQVIRAVDGVSDDGICGALDTTTTAGWRGHWRTDPAALDGGLQLALLWAQHRLGGHSLPTGLSSYQRYAVKPAGPLSCTLTGRVDGDSRAVSDITFRDADDRVVAVLQGVETHRRP